MSHVGEVFFLMNRCRCEDTKQVDVVYAVYITFVLYAMSVCVCGWELFNVRALRIVTFGPQHD